MNENDIQTPPLKDNWNPDSWKKTPIPTNNMARHYNFSGFYNARGTERLGLYRNQIGSMDECQSTYQKYSCERIGNLHIQKKN